MKSGGSQNVIWAIDPFSRDPRQLMKARQALEAWEKSQPLSVQPVSLLTPRELQWPLGLAATQEHEFHQLTEGLVRPLLRSVQMKGLAEPSILIHGSRSRKSSIARMSEYAQQCKARFILTTTHQRRGLAKFFISSFTQELIEESLVPVLTVRPDSRVPRRFSRLLFATDFSKACQDAFNDVLQLAVDFHSQIVLFHRLDAPDLPFGELPAAFAANAEFLRRVSRENERLQWLKARRLQEMAQQRGINLEIVLMRGLQPLGQLIQRSARQFRADLIVLPLQPRSWMRSLLGSSVRDVIQTCCQPVLTIPVHVHRSVVHRVPRRESSHLH